MILYLSPWKKNHDNYHQSDLILIMKFISNPISIPYSEPLYKLSQAELNVQREWLNGNLEKGFI
jgi:hypothetical protein